MLASYLTHAKQKQQKLEQLIAKGKQMGVEEDKLNEGLKKLAALKEGIEEAQRDLGE